jgi:hypothetical protein
MGFREDLMRRRGVASSLALLASIIVLTTQICINMAFMEVMSEEIVEKARKVIESKDFNQLLLVAVNETTLVAINRENRDFLVSGMSFHRLNNGVVDIEVEWQIPRMSTSMCRVPQGLEGCVAVVLKVEGGREVMVPLYRAPATTLSES